MIRELPQLLTSDNNPRVSEPDKPVFLGGSISSGLPHILIALISISSQLIESRQSINTMALQRDFR